MKSNYLTPVSDEEKREMLEKSVAALPDSPGAAGFKAKDVKNSITSPLFDRDCSLLFCIERLITECNQILSSLDERLTKIEEALSKNN